MLAALLQAPLAGALETRSQLGPVTATVRFAPDEPRIGDALQLEVEVVAEEGVEVLMPEFGEALDRFTILDFAPREGLDDTGRTVYTQRYTLEAPTSGEHTLPSILIEFVDRRPGRDPAPEGRAAYELLTDPLTLEVASVVLDVASADLSPPAGRLEPRSEGGGFAWAWLAVSLLGMAGVAPFAWRALVKARERSRRRSAYDIASEELQELLAPGRPGDAEVDAFFVTLSGIVRRYLESRFGVRSPEYTTEEFLERVSGSPDLTRAHQAVLRGFLEQADLVKFAHHRPSAADIDEAIASATRFVEETRELGHRPDDTMASTASPSAVGAAE